MMLISFANPLSLVLDPVQDLLLSLQPVIDFLTNLVNFIVHHPVLSVIILLVTFFLVSGLVQKIMEWSRNFWDYVLLYLAKFIQFIFQQIWNLVIFLFRFITSKNIPKPQS